MTLSVRRVVTGHDENGASIISSDEIIEPMNRGAGANVIGCEIWSTDRMPVDNSPSAEESQKAGFVYVDRNSDRPRDNFVRTGGGTLMRIIEWGADNPPYRHRTESADYIVILSGEIDCDLDGDVRVHLKAGDTLIQRGGFHTWRNRGSQPCVMAVIMLDATPVVVDGSPLRTHYPE